MGCDLIIDGGSCNNVASMTLTDNLQVPTKVHPTPYTLQWLKQGSDVIISKQALISFWVGPCCGEVLCDVLHMDICHVFLGRPWLFDNYVMHDGHTNTYAMKLKDRNLILAPLPPPKPFKFKPGSNSEKSLYMSQT